MERSEIYSRLLAFINETFPHQGMELSGDTDLLNDWFVDSLGIIQTVVFFEEEFSIDMDGADVNVNNFYSINTLTDFAANRISSKQKK